MSSNHDHNFIHIIPFKHTAKQKYYSPLLKTDDTHMKPISSLYVSPDFILFTSNTALIVIFFSFTKLPNLVIRISPEFRYYNKNKRTLSEFYLGNRQKQN